MKYVWFKSWILIFLPESLVLTLREENGSDFWAKQLKERNRVPLRWPDDRWVSQRTAEMERRGSTKKKAVERWRLRKVLVWHLTDETLLRLKVVLANVAITSLCIFNWKFSTLSLSSGLLRYHKTKTKNNKKIEHGVLSLGGFKGLF